LLLNILVDFIYEALFVFAHDLFTLSENLAHKLRQIVQVILTFLGPFFNFLVQKAEITSEVIKFELRFFNLILLRFVNL